MTGLPWSPSYLFAGERPVLFEAGFHCMGKFYERDIKGVLGSRQPEMLFLSHVHWDHCGASAHLKRIFPGMKIAASRKAAAIMKRPNAVKLMERLSGEVIPLVEAIDGIDHNLLVRLKAARSLISARLLMSTGLFLSSERYGLPENQRYTLQRSTEMRITRDGTRIMSSNSHQERLLRYITT